MRVSILLTLALFGAAFAADTVFVSNADVRASLTASGSSVARTWIGAGGIANTASFLGYKGQSTTTAPGQTTSTASAAYVTSNGPNAIFSFPFGVNWGYFSGEAKSNGGAYDASATAVMTSFRIYGYVTYTDANGNGAYDQGEETSLRTFQGSLLSSVDVENNPAQDGKPQFYLVTHTGVSSKMRYVLAQQDITSQKEFNKAENAKIDFWFKPEYTSKDDPTKARVALITAYAAFQASVKAGGNVQDDQQHRSGRGSLSFSSGGVSSELQWSPVAASLASDGSVSSVQLKSQVLALDQSVGFKIKAGTNVNGNVLSNDYSIGVDTSATKFSKSNVLIFSFDAQRPSELYWDPSVGQSGNAYANVASLFVILAAIAVSLF